jgi:putative oxidoreductase
MDTRQNLANSVGLLILRLGVGGLMASHGCGKLQMLIAGQFDQMGDPIHIGAVASLVLVTGAEFFCAILVALGLGTRFAAAPVAFAMGVAALVVHGNDPWSMETAAKQFFAGESKTWFSKEPALLFLIPFLALIFTGAGRFSLDHLIRCRRRRPAAPADIQTR